jgi:hypothetical protein
MHTARSHGYDVVAPPRCLFAAHGPASHGDLDVQVHCYAVLALSVGSTGMSI